MNAEFLRNRFTPLNGLLLRGWIVVLCAWLGPETDAFEQDQRINSFTLQFTTDAFATVNAFGSAFVYGTTQAGLNAVIDANIVSDSLSLLMEMPGLTDLRGTNQASFQIGFVNGVPVLDTNNPTPYSGHSDLDWWYTPNVGELDAIGIPTRQLSASITTGVLSSTNAGQISLIPSPLIPRSQATRLDLSDTRIRADIGASSLPLQSSNGFPPGHRPTENIDPQLVSFASMSGGKLAGNISAASLAGTQIPSGFGLDGYTATNSLLDLLVGGATQFGFVVLVKPTQPDQSNPAAPVVGAGPPYRFSATTGRTVDTARDKNNAVVNLNAALNAAAYSAYFTFTTDRVIAESAPDITVEQPDGTGLTTGAGVVEFGTLQGSTASALKVFTVRNAGLADLTGLVVSKTGDTNSLFGVNSTGMSTTLVAGATTVFTATFTSGNFLSATAVLHIASNDPDENPFDISLSGIALSATKDSDEDGLNDWAEYQLAPLGFNWQVSQPSLVNTFFSNAKAAGLYTASQVQALNVGTPLISRDPATGRFTLTIGATKSADLVSFLPFPFNLPNTTINAQGQIQFEFTSQENAAFFRLESR